MKKVKLFEQYITEMEYGKELLTDPNALPRADYFKKLGLPFEPNTVEENELIAYLQEWMMNPHTAAKDPTLGLILKELLPLKKKFPKILDPKAGRHLYEGKSLYRGTTIPLKELIALSGKWQPNLHLDYPTGAIQIKTKYNWKGMGLSQKGFTSFTPSQPIAIDFARETDHALFGPFQAAEIVRALEAQKDRMIAVVLEIPDTYANAIMNPHFTLSAAQFLTEYEVFVLGQPIQIERIHLPDWQLLQAEFERANIQPNKYFKGL
jgi:hypothetical protein